MVDVGEKPVVINASPLTADTVFTLVRKVKSWRKLAKELVWAYDQDNHQQDIARHNPYSTDLDALQRQLGSDEECLKSVIEKFLQRKGGRYNQPSWRAVIWSLYRANEIQLASHIKIYGEPLQDASLTVDNVTKVMEMVPPDRMLEVWTLLDVPESLVEMISGNLSTTKEKTRACVDLYLNYSPNEPSWEIITSVLYFREEMAAAREAKPFYHQNDPTLTVGNVTKVMEKTTMDKRRGVWEEVLGGRAVEEIYSSHSSEEKKLHSCADTYATCKPNSSWEDLVQWLYDYGEMAAAKEAKAFLQQKDPTLTVNNVTDVMEKVTMDKRRNVWWRVLGSGQVSLVGEIYSSHSSEKEKTHACSDAYANFCPESSWEHLTSLLYEEDEMTAVDQARPFLPPGDLTLTTDRLTELFQSVEDPDSATYGYGSIGEWLGLPESVLGEIRRSYQSKTKRKDAYLDTYTHRHPCPSWKKIRNVLRLCDLHQQANEVENTYVQVSERTQHNFDIAMQGGYAMIRNGSVFFLGPGGSGKTLTLHSLLEEDPPSIRQSTPCAKRTVRTIAQCKVGVKDIHFVRIKDDQYSDMLSNTAKQQQTSTSSTIPLPAQFRQQETTSGEITSANSQASSVDTQETDSPTISQEASVSSPEKKKKHPSNRSGFEREMLRRMQLVPKRSENLIDKDLIDMKDSGGQPMFHEVLPLFVQNTTFGVLTVKLNEKLDSYPMVDYYSNGKPVGEPFPSPFTHLQTYHHCMRVLQSTCSRDTCPKLVFIGTHKDHERECLDENREEKNRKLRSIIPQDLKQSIIYCDPLNDGLLFPVNVKMPENEDRRMISRVRQMMIRELRKLPQQKIPLQYIALENAFSRLAKYQRKAILSKADCFQEAAAFHFTKESFEKALMYLHDLKLIFYYEEVLPEVVFIDAQTILDKITELVEFSLSKLAHELTISMDIKEFEEFKAYGIVTLELLSQFSSHYVPGLFMQQQLVLLLEYLRVIAKVGKGKYLVPCLLKVTAITNPLPHSTSRSICALLFYFGPNGPKLGVYCCLLASLITEAKWELLTENNRPVQVSRNQVRFRLPKKDPGAITITDSFSTFFHVSIDFPDDMSPARAIQISKKVCPIIRETILTGIRKASQKLNYNNSIPEVAFPCSKHVSGDLHPATISDSGCLTCTTHPADIFDESTEKHKLWLGKEGLASQEQKSSASISALTGVNQSQMFDQVLDSDHDGVLKHLGQIADTMYEWKGPVADNLGLTQADVAGIKTKYPEELKLQVRAALEKWKQSKGSSATYRNLIVAFEQAGHKDFAETVQRIAVTGIPSTTTTKQAAEPNIQPHNQQKDCDSTTSPAKDPAAAASGSSHEPHQNPTFTTTSFDASPSLATLSTLRSGGKKIQIIKTLAPDWNDLGDLLDFDQSGTELGNIEEAHSTDKARCKAMFQHWLNGNGVRPCSWRKLIQLLEDCDQEALAKEIQDVLTSTET